MKLRLDPKTGKVLTPRQRALRVSKGDIKTSTNRSAKNGISVWTPKPDPDDPSTHQTSDGHTLAFLAPAPGRSLSAFQHRLVQTIGMRFGCAICNTEEPAEWKPYRHPQLPKSTLDAMAKSGKPAKQIIVPQCYECARPKKFKLKDETISLEDVRFKEKHGTAPADLWTDADTGAYKPTPPISRYGSLIARRNSLAAKQVMHELTAEEQTTLQWLREEIAKDEQEQVQVFLNKIRMKAESQITDIPLEELEALERWADEERAKNESAPLEHALGQWTAEERAKGAQASWADKTNKRFVDKHSNHDDSAGEGSQEIPKGADKERGIRTLKEGILEPERPVINPVQVAEPTTLVAGAPVQNGAGGVIPAVLRQGKLPGIPESYRDVTTVGAVCEPGEGGASLSPPTHPRSGAKRDENKTVIPLFPSASGNPQQYSALDADNKGETLIPGQVISHVSVENDSGINQTDIDKNENDENEALWMSYPKHLKDKLQVLDNFPPMECSTCAIGADCREYKEGSTCAYNVLFDAVPSGTHIGRVAFVEWLVDQDRARTMVALMQERVQQGGQLDPKVSAQLDGHIARLEKLSLIKRSPSIPQVPSFTGRRVVMEEHGAAPSQGTGIFGRLFGAPAEEKVLDSLENTPSRPTVPVETEPTK